MKEYDVYVSKCGTYAEEEVERALDEALAGVGGLEFVKPGMTIAVKPNLVASRSPNAAATTHPAIIKALCKRITDLGATAVIGDSPGGPHSLLALNRVYSASGMTALERPGVTLNRNMEQKTAVLPAAKAAKEFKYTAYLDDADAIIDVCKLKSHGMLGMSAAVKNLFGCIPGLVKPEMHYQFPDDDMFAEMLIDLNEFFKPRLAIVDAVVGMEGNGPTAGDPREIGLILASKSTYLADIVCAELIGMDMEGLPTLRAAYERGLAPRDSTGLELNYDIKTYYIKDFKAPAVHGLNFMRKGTLLGGIARRALAHKPKLYPAACVGCGECAKICPAHAIEMVKRAGRSAALPRIDRGKCIRCFCCQEFCPKAAMRVHRPLIAKIVNR